jgi:hypothetical protein
MASLGFNPFARHAENQTSKSNGQEKSASTPEPQTPTDGQRTFHVVNSVASTPEPRAATAGNAAETEERPSARPVEKKPASAARTNKVMLNPFDRHVDEKKPSNLIRLNRAHEVPPAQRLMAWLPRWPKATISVRDVRLYGPNSLRNTKIATDAIEVLAGYGWLVPVMAPAYNQKWWEIIRAPEQPEQARSRPVAAL